MATVSRQHSMPSLMEDGEEHSHACCDRKRSPAQFELGAGTRVTGQGGELAARRKNNRARTQSAHRGCARSGLTGGPRIFTTPNYNLRPDLIIIWRAARLGDSPPSLEPASLPERTEAERRGRGWRGGGGGGGRRGTSCKDTGASAGGAEGTFEGALHQRAREHAAGAKRTLGPDLTLGLPPRADPGRAPRPPVWGRGRRGRSGQQREGERRPPQRRRQAGVRRGGGAALGVRVRGGAVGVGWPSSPPRGGEVAAELLGHHRGDQVQEATARPLAGGGLPVAQLHQVLQEGGDLLRRLRRRHA
ncbi:unnamed protein product [Prorocentrum cordatum]|uniref:Uncharacterized protein n=1 Tax=Prorocentrum cordatum TaxID=2364126 RepID=A0ABN9XYQ4_9DINO|nr:unnamed protein product [Polarella glacialis]